MRQFFKMFFASLLALVIGSLLVVFLVIGLIASLANSADDDKETRVEANSVLLIETSRTIRELGERNPFAVFSGHAPYDPGLYDITTAMERAKDDKNIEGIMLRLGYSMNGWATLYQLRTALADFRKSGKFIYAYGEMVPQKSYYLASVADSIFINPAGFTEMYGLSSELPFFKGTLDKLEVEPEIFYAGKFKSATEPFRAEKMSEPNREQIMALQNSVWVEFAAAVAVHAKTTPAQIHQLAQQGAIQFPEDAVRYKIADALAYADEVESRIKLRTGIKADDKIKYVGMDDYAANLRKKRRTAGDRIAVLIAEGTITDGTGNDDMQIASEEFVEEIKKLRNNKKVKAVVLRVNSPGGSALASEVILRELQLLKKEKPLIVSMGDVAASGGYYIACQADSIFALPNTITGSIGVYTMLFNAEKMFRNKLGITFDQVKNAPYADFPTATRKLTAEETARMQASVDTIYGTFKRRVAAGRRMQEALVDSFAQGRVWSGTDALRIGLVDGLGGLDRAVASAAKKAGLKDDDYKVMTYPEPADRFERILSAMGNANVSKDVAKAVVEESMGEEYALVRQIKALQQMNGRAQMLMPFQVTIK